MIYAAFTLWLLLIVAAGRGVYRLWTALVKPVYVHWVLLPGTLVAEMAYIFGCLITGGEVRKAKLLDSAGGESGESSEGGTHAAARFKFIGPAVASLCTLLACGGGIVAVHSLLGEPVLSVFSLSLGWPGSQGLAQTLPTSWDGFWDILSEQVVLLKLTCQTWAKLDWLNWRVPLFVYLATCLSVRLAPARRDVRALLAAVVLVAVIIAAVGLVSSGFNGLVHDLWPLLAYIWATVLFLLAATLTVRGMTALVRALAGKSRT